MPKMAANGLCLQTLQGMLRDNRDAKMDIPRTALTGCSASIVGALTSGFSPTTTFRHQQSWQLTGSEDVPTGGSCVPTQGFVQREKKTAHEPVEKEDHDVIRSRIQCMAMLFLPLLLSAVASGTNDQASEPSKFFREYVGLKDDEIASIRRGKPIAKILESRTPDEVFVFGSVYLETTPERYLKFSADIDGLRRIPSYLAIQKFSDPPQLADLNGFTLEPEDVKQLKNCKPGHCEIQLPAESMEEFQKEVNWSAPDTADQVNRLAQRMALEALLRYIQGGNAALGTYRDKNHPAQVAETFQSLLSRSKALPAYLPDLDRYLLDYPATKLDNVESQFYWEKVNFGLKPTLRIVQAIVYRGVRSTQPAYVVAVKQLTPVTTFRPLWISPSASRTRKAQTERAFT